MFNGKLQIIMWKTFLLCLFQRVKTVTTAPIATRLAPWWAVHDVIAYNPEFAHFAETHLIPRPDAKVRDPSKCHDQDAVV